MVRWPMPSKSALWSAKRRRNGIWYRLSNRSHKREISIIYQPHFDTLCFGGRKISSKDSKVCIQGCAIVRIVWESFIMIEDSMHLTTIMLSKAETEDGETLSIIGGH